MSSELPPPPAPPAPAAEWPAGAPPTRRPVPRDQPSRTSPLTIALEAIALALLGGTIALNMLLGQGADIPGIVLAFGFTLQRTAGWWFRTYTVTDAAVLLDEGILQRHHRVVPFSRIQQVELRQQLTSRLFGIVTVHIETAGDAGSTAITLRSLDVPGAEALREHLLAEQRRVRTGQPAGPRGHGAHWHDAFRAPVRTPLHRLAAGELLAAGATSSATLITAALALVPAAAIAGANLDGLASLALFAGIAIAATGAITAVATLGSLLSGWGFDITASDDDLQVTQGLLDRRQHTMPRHRLQHVRITDNPLRRALGIASVELYSAATPGRRDEQRTAISIPLVRRAEVGDLLVRCMGDDRWRLPALEPRGHVARRRAIVRRTALTTATTLAVVALLFPAGLVLAPIALLGLPWGALAHRRAGSSLHGDVLAVASGALVHHVELVPAERVQSRRTTASPFQRRLGLATLRLDVAGARRGRGAPGLGDLAQAVADEVRSTVPPRRPRPVPAA